MKVAFLKNMLELKGMTMSENKLEKLLTLEQNNIEEFRDMGPEFNFILLDGVSKQILCASKTLEEAKEDLKTATQFYDECSFPVILDAKKDCFFKLEYRMVETNIL